MLIFGKRPNYIDVTKVFPSVAIILIDSNQKFWSENEGKRQLG